MIVLAEMACPLCSGSYDEVCLSFPRQLFKIVRCRKCGMVRLNPRVAESDLDKIYHSTFCGDIKKPLDESPRSFFDWKLQRMTNRIHHHRLTILEKVTSSRNLLEIGCGDGGFLAYLQQYGWQVIGTEYTPYAVALGRKKGIEVLEGELQDLELPSEHYDVIAMYYVLEHVYHPKDLLEEIHRILRPRGILVIEVPNIGSLSARLFGASWYLLAVPQHVNHFSPRTLTQMLESTGFVVSCISHSAPESFVSWKLGLKTVVRKLLGAEKKGGSRFSLRNLDEKQLEPGMEIPVRTQIIDLFLDPIMCPVSVLEKALSNGTIFTVVAEKPSLT